MTADALILDFGRVVTRTLFETHRDTERAPGLVTGTLTWRRPFDPATDRSGYRLAVGPDAGR